jgi:hypothetical protein
VDALHAAVLRAGENVTAARRLLAEQGPDSVLLQALLRRSVPRAFLETLAVTPPWSRNGRVLAALVLSPQAPPRVSVPVLPSLFWHDLAEVARTLRVAPPVRARAEALLVERLPDLRLGERITLSRLATPPVLRVLLQETEPRVVQACLPNPRLREEDLLTVLRMDAAPVVLLESAARSQRWAGNYAVRLELVLQPRTPLALALAQLTSLVRRDLVRVSRTRALRPLVRAAALRALDGRWEDLGPGGKSRGIRKID